MNESGQHSSVLKQCAIGLSFLWALSACGLQPLYGKHGAAGTAVSDQFRKIYISEIGDAQAGQTLRNHLIDIMGATQLQAQARYLLSITVDLEKEGLAIQSNANVTRVNLRMVANYRLFDQSRQKVATEGAVRAISSYNVIRSDYANLFSERDAVRRAAYRTAEEIRARIAVHATQ